jgi:hypothetical protein
MEVIFVHDGFKRVPYEVEFDLRGIERVKTLYTNKRFMNWGHSLRDYGMRLADGEYILNFNIDNLLYPECLEKVNACIDGAAPPPEMVIFSIIHHKNKTRRFDSFLTGRPVEVGYIDCLQAVASKRAWESIGFWHRTEYESDGHLYAELSSKYEPAYVDEVLAENF